MPSPRTITIFSDFLPRHDASSSNLRVAELVTDLARAGYRIRYCWWLPTENDDAYLTRFAHVATFTPCDWRSGALLEELQQHPCDLVIFTNLWGTDWLRAIAETMTVLRNTRPGLPILVDTMDVHAKKYDRKFRMTNDSADKALADNFRTLEARIYPLADHIVVVSEEERTDLHADFGHDLPVSVVGNVHAATTAPPGITGREHFVFLGNYGVPHNVDAVRWFLENVWQNVLAALPHAQLHLVGSAAEKLPQDITQQHEQCGVVVRGYVADVPQVLADYRVMVVPMTYGAGMKGKIGNAAACGLPIVTTTIGAEGYAFTHGTHALIDDTPDGFARNCIAAYTDEALWLRLSRSVLELMRTTYDATDTLAAFRATVATLLGSMPGADTSS